MARFNFEHWSYIVQYLLRFILLHCNKGYWHHYIFYSVYTRSSLLFYCIDISHWWVFRAQICKRKPRNRFQGINSESIPRNRFRQGYVAWRAGTSKRVVVSARQSGSRFLGSLKGLQIRAQVSLIACIVFFVSIFSFLYFSLLLLLRLHLYLSLCIALPAASTTTVTDFWGQILSP